MKVAAALALAALLPGCVAAVVPVAAAGVIGKKQTERPAREPAVVDEAPAAARLTLLPAGTTLVVRALPAAADATYARLGADLDAALAAARSPRGRRSR